MQSWPLRDAKNRLGRLLDEAKEAAQLITVRGREVAVVVSVDEYRRLTRPEGNLVDFLRASPLVGVDLEVERDTDLGRPIDL